MTFAEMYKKAYTEYATNPKVRYIGYNTVKGSRMYGTLNNVDVAQCIGLRWELKTAEKENNIIEELQREIERKR
jgi:hypothetical protein